VADGRGRMEFGIANGPNDLGSTKPICSPVSLFLLSCKRLDHSARGPHTSNLTPPDRPAPPCLNCFRGRPTRLPVCPVGDNPPTSKAAEPSRWRRRWPRYPAPLPASRLVSASLPSALSAPQLRPARPRSGGWYCTASRGAASAMDSRRSSTPRRCSLARPTPSRPSSSRQANLLALLPALHCSN